MSRISSLWLLALFVVVLFMLQPMDLEWLRYERDNFLVNWWQSVTHMLIHLNYAHLTLNAVTLIVLYFLFTEAFETFMWIPALLVSAIISSMGLYFYSPDVEWCVGLSGAMHGLFIYLVYSARAHWIWAIAIAAKIIFEQLAPLLKFSSPDLTEQLIDGNVVIDAHLWGGVGGSIFVALLAMTRVGTFIEVMKR